MSRGSPPRIARQQVYAVARVCLAGNWPQPRSNRGTSGSRPRRTETRTTSSSIGSTSRASDTVEAVSFTSVTGIGLHCSPSRFASKITSTSNANPSISAHRKDFDGSAAAEQLQPALRVGQVVEDQPLDESAEGARRQPPQPAAACQPAGATRVARAKHDLAFAAANPAKALPQRGQVVGQIGIGERQHLAGGRQHGRADRVSLAAVRQMHRGKTRAELVGQLGGSVLAAVIGDQHAIIDLQRIEVAFQRDERPWQARIVRCRLAERRSARGRSDGGSPTGSWRARPILRRAGVACRGQCRCRLTQAA